VTGAAPPREQSTAPVFIVGCRRSGTTLVSRIVDTHPAFSVYHESFLYPIFQGELRWYGDLRDRRNFDRLVADVRQVLATQIPDLPSGEEIHAAAATASLSGVFGALLELHARRQGKRRGGDKTPEHHRYIGEILRDFGASPVVVTVRDPRDTVLSIRRVFDTSVEGAAHVWRNAYESYRPFADRVHVVKYESLVREPEAEVRRLCEVLGEPFDPAMLEFHRHVPEEFRRPGGEKLSAPIDPGSVGQFRTMAERDIRTIEAVCGEAMEALGYEFAAGSRPAAGGSPRRPSRWRWVLDRLRYYGLNRRRWERGAARWKIMMRVRWHWLRKGRGAPP
jgi:hypothetical protein